MPNSSIKERCQLFSKTNSAFDSRIDLPVGVFDSGIGGLSILKGIAAELPDENLIYLADSGFAPYGDRSVDEISERTFKVVSWLVDKGVKAIVIACNTATAAAVKELRATYTLPIIGIEPGVKPAVLSTQTGRVGILATQYTVESEKFRRLIEPFKKEVELYVQAAPGLVETLETPGDHRIRLNELLKCYLDPMVAQGVDRLVLGCTHYSFLMDEILQILPEGIEVIDTPAAVAREVRRRLAIDHLLRDSDSELVTEFYSTARDQKHSSAQFQRLLGYEMQIKQPDNL